MAKNYEILSQEEVDQLHEAFMERLQARARKFIPEDAANNNYVLLILTNMLLTAARQRIKINEDTLDALAKPHQLQSSKPLRDLMRVKNNYVFNAGDSKMLDNAEAGRKDDPVIEQIFGDRKRIYLRCDVELPSETREEVEQILAQKGYTITSYKDGHATDAGGKQQFKIGRLLKDHEDALKRFEDDPTRVGETLVVISRDTMDLALMSTNRGWTSCMDMAKWKDERSYIPTQISDGALVAYLISSRDPEINAPLARITIKTFSSRDEFEALDEARRELEQAKHHAAPHRKSCTDLEHEINKSRAQVKAWEDESAKLKSEAETLEKYLEAARNAATQAAEAERKYKAQHPVGKHLITARALAKETERRAAKVKELAEAASKLQSAIELCAVQRAAYRERLEQHIPILPKFTAYAERAERKVGLLTAKFNRAKARLERAKAGTNYAYAASKMYGMGNEAFRQVVEIFIEEVLNKGKFGLFSINAGMYKDGLDDHIRRKGTPPMRAVL